MAARSSGAMDKNRANLVAAKHSSKQGSRVVMVAERTVGNSKLISPKKVTLGDTPHPVVVCHSPDEAAQDRAPRKAGPLHKVPPLPYPPGYEVPADPRRRTWIHRRPKQFERSVGFSSDAAIKADITDCLGIDGVPEREWN